MIDPKTKKEQKKLSFRKKFFKWIMGLGADEFVSVSVVSHTPSGVNIFPSDHGMNENYLFDFKNWNGGQGNQLGGTFFGNGVVPAAGGATDGNMGVSNSGPPQKIKIKPVDVLNELEKVPTPFDLILLDEKISVLKDKEKLINQDYSKREITALIQRLENRKKYPEYKEYFDKFQNTTDEKIDVLLEKYDLVMKTADIFIPEFPDIAVQTMKEYTEKIELVCGKKPVFYVIAEPQLFKKAYEKRDPILLVQSPFGFYWQILGAWDKEMLLLSEL